MARIVGWIPGAARHAGRVVEVWKGVGVYNVANYNVRWTLLQGNQEDPVTGTDQCQYGPWSTLGPGSPIVLVTVPGDGRYYYLKSIWVEPANFAFDYVLLALELTGVVIGLTALWPRRYSRYGPPPGS